MTRVLKFDADAPTRTKRFDCLVIAVYSAGNKTTPRNRQTIGQEARLLDALDQVSVPALTEDPVMCTNCGAALHVMHVHQSAVAEKRSPIAGAELVLDADAYQLLGHYLETTPWLPSAARQAVDALNWFDAAEVRD